MHTETLGSYKHIALTSIRIDYIQTQTQLQIHTESVFIFSGPPSLSAEVPYQHTFNPC